MKFHPAPIGRFALIAFLLVATIFQPQSSASAAVTLTITPNSWNVIGLDSNTPASGPYRFPIGAKICSSVATTDVVATFVWDDATNASDIYLRTGSLSSITIPSISAGGCADAYFEVEVNRATAPYDKTRRYHITADDANSDAVSTPQPREVYVEHLISQNRNSITNVELNGTSIPAGGVMNLIVGNTYTIKLYGGTATQGYNQFEDFINFPNTIFQIQSVSTTYSADSRPLIVPPATSYPYLYADACGWDNDPDSPTYRSCIDGDDKAGGSNVVTTYVIKVIGGAGSSETLNTLLYDFSGSSYHYNADYSAGARTVNVIGPSSVTIKKTFSPKAIAPAGTSTMSFKLTNPTTETITGVNFTDTLLGGLKVAATPGVTYSGCGAGAFSPALVADATSLSFSGGTLAPNSACTINVTVTAPAGTFPNTTGHLFINSTTDTGNTSTDTLTASSAPACSAGQTLAKWSMNPSSVTVPPAVTTQAADVTTANASSPVGIGSVIDTALGSPAVNSWQTYGFRGSASFTTADNDYVEFLVDTSKYQQVGMSFNYYSNGNGPKSLYVYYNNGGGLTGPLASYNAVNDDTWHSSTTIDFTGLTSTTGTTTFRIYGWDALNNNSGANLNFDEITFTGCGTPIPPPTITKSFLDPSLLTPVTAIKKGLTSVLRFSIANTAAGNQALSGIAFTDVLPAGLDVATTSTSQCGGTVTTTAGTRTIVLSGGSLSAGASCTIDVTVTGTIEGQYDNVSGYISSTQSGASTNYATDSLTVIAPPNIVKSFSPTSLFTGSASTLTFTISNPNTSNSLSGIGFTDSLPAGVDALTSSSAQCGGTLTVTDNAPAVDTIVLTGGSLAANVSCTFNVAVTGTTSGTKNNTTSAITSTEGGNGNTASASLVVADLNGSIDLTKQISATGATGPWTNYVSVNTSSNVWYRFKVYNSGTAPLTAVNVTESLGSIDPSTCTWPEPFLPGETAYCVKGPIATSATPGSYNNTATAHGTYNSIVYNSSTSTATYANPSLLATKNVTETYFTAAGNILHYSYTAKNNGFAPLLGPVTITDDKVGTVTCQAVTAVGDLDAYLDVNETVICPATGTADYTVIGTDVTNKLVTNTAHATAGGVDSPNVSKTVPLAPDLTLTKTNDTADTVVLGNTFKWTLTASNSSSAGAATFTTGQTLLTDDLPASGATYSVGTVSIVGGTSGPINCSILTNTLTCVAGATDVTIPSGASFSVPITVTPTATGNLANPRAAGICKVDPTPSVAEIDDTNNDCLSNTVTVTKATPSLTTTAAGPVTIGSNITDTAHLAGGYGTLSGTITFDVFAPGDTTCATPLTAPTGATVTGAGDYSSGNFAATSVGDYRWIAHYSGDANNLNVDTACNDANETSTVNKASPTVTTQLKFVSDDTNITNPILTGTALYDTAVLASSYNAGGTVTYIIYSDNTCATLVQDVTPATNTVVAGVIPNSANYTFNNAGNFWYQAVYSGDANNNSATGICTSEPVIVSSVILPVATITVAPPSVLEDGATNLVYTVTLDKAPLVDTTINLTTTGTATTATDYTGSVASVTILAGTTTATVTIDPAVDSAVEPDETVIIIIDPGTGYTVGTPSSATGAITNDDIPVATITVAPPSVLEDGATNLVYTVTLDKAPLVDTTINLTTTGTATTATDYTGSVASVTILAGTTTATVTIDPAVDSAVEPDETVIITIDPGTGYTVGTPSSATGAITNDDAAVDLSLTKIVDNSSPKIGDAVIFTITVTNHSLTAATNVVISDSLPAGLTFNSSTPSIGNYNSSSGDWTITTLSANTSATLQLNVTVTQIGVITNTAEITASDQPDPDSVVNNHVPTEDDQSSVSLGGLFDPPSGIKTFNDAGLPELEFRLVWINSGNTSAINTQITDSIPAGTTYVIGSVACAPQGSSTNAAAASAPLNTALANSFCTYDPINNRIQWQGSIGPDNGNLTEAAAANELVITFRVTVGNAVNEVHNTSASRTDTDGDTDFNDETVVGVSLIDTNEVVWTRDMTLPDELPSTGFAPNVITSLPEQPAAKMYAATDVWIEIPSLGVNIPIIGVPLIDKEWDVSWLWKQAGWLNGTAFPGWSGNSVLTSHVTLPNGKAGPFAQLGKLKWGDRILIHSYGSVYTYEVRENRTVSPNNTSVLKHEEEAWVTLITCKTYNEKTETYFNRIAVRAVLIKVALEK